MFIRDSLSIFSLTKISRLKVIQLNPAPTDFRGPTIFFCYKRTSFIDNKGNKKLTLKNHELTSVIGGIPLVAGPLERGLTVLRFGLSLVRFIYLLLNAALTDPTVEKTQFYRS